MGHGRNGGGAGTMDQAADVLEREVSAESLTIAGGGDIDIQVTTARRYPRSITTFIRKAQEMATLSPEIAASCIYAIPRDGKTVEGPSARFAEVMCSAWGNVRAEGKTIGDDGKYVTARGTTWDVENNVAIAFEVRRRITNKNGQPFNADMVMTTGNAAASIALRNSILKVIPTAFWKPIYNAVRKVIAGDAKTFATRRDDMLKAFAVMGVTEDRICTAISVKGKADITLEHMTVLTGFYNALKDGDTTIEEAFPEPGAHGGLQAPRRKSETAPRQPEAASAPATLPVVTVAGIHSGKGKRDGKAIEIWTIELSSGITAWTSDEEIATAAQRAQTHNAPVDMTAENGEISEFVTGAGQ
jgi:hypothetical protein